MYPAPPVTNTFIDSSPCTRFRSTLAPRDCCSPGRGNCGPSGNRGGTYPSLPEGCGGDCGGIYPSPRGDCGGIYVPPGAEDLPPGTPRGASFSTRCPGASCS